MAGAAIGGGLSWSRPPSDIMGRFPIKSAEVINLGDLVAIDSNGQVIVAAKTVQRALGVAVFDDENSGVTSRTGVAGLTVFCSIARRAKVAGFTATILPGTQTIGNNVYLGATPTSTVSNYTMTGASANNDIVQPVGVLVSTTGGINASAEVEVFCDPSYTKYVSTLANANVNYTY